jgi:hypothetical protein
MTRVGCSATGKKGAVTGDIFKMAGCEKNLIIYIYIYISIYKWEN